MRRNDRTTKVGKVVFRRGTSKIRIEERGDFSPLLLLGIGGVALDGTLALHLDVGGSQRAGLDHLPTQSRNLLRGQVRFGGKDRGGDTLALADEVKQETLQFLVGNLLLRQSVTPLFVLAVEVSDFGLSVQDNFLRDFVVDDGGEKFTVGHSVFPFLRWSQPLSFMALL